MDTEGTGARRPIGVVNALAVKRTLNAMTGKSERRPAFAIHDASDGFGLMLPPCEFRCRCTCRRRCRERDRTKASEVRHVLSRITARRSTWTSVSDTRFKGGDSVSRQRSSEMSA
ncbi:hypothetical protein AKJ09_07727 [Labilithrix luteola]|uniref:Uncharacterized protein n=1 Tax=Labilithrix luteola TaxID=1391654 RepID=A0A0K1Q5Q8_9BACT|nr:hypothetical protein AKJ09_07727 [Labilithrix luteola]